MKYLNTMKKILLLLGIVGLFGIANAQNAIKYDSTSFINNGTYVCLTNNATSTFYSAGSATNIIYYSFAYGTNIMSGAIANTNTGSLYPPVFVDVPYFPDANSDVNTNATITALVGVYSNMTTGTFQSPVVGNTVWTNPTPFYAYSATQTNTVTLTFAGVPNGNGYVDQNGQATSTTNKTLTVILNYTSLPCQVSTPVGGVFVGYNKIRLISAQIANVAAPGVVLDALTLNQWHP